MDLLPGKVKNFILIDMKDADPPSRRRTGRPLSFDREAALEQAMLLFWRHGYEATSLAELTRAMGVTSPSIYAAYGDKKGLFREAVARYLAQPLPPADMVAQAEDATAAARWLLEGAAAMFTGEATPPGCLLASSAIAVSVEADDVRRELAAIRLGVEAALRDKILADMACGRLPAETDAVTLAAYVTSVIQGLSTLARDGAPREKLMKVARFALSAWPARSVRT
ncbi:TetR/AcrR family transcriptional regulator [Pararoseomonas indoligenes]|uniref:TetR/AcrR family transcriptional regulator n=1 Tax=Roseomonas indoligenes TaxID=2820811 RepID=A0A940N2Q3_9PROT|nr:TetR/AcrR family transcriptional regulator [Pararoseomonas indoligenes]MBP0495489.1 TetR/AcrR family transcriptional regulator [Pararoseomonas indoligenes]